MYITIHKKISPVLEGTIIVQHSMLSKEIQNFLKEEKVEQKTYPIFSEGDILFIYLNDNKRVDVQVL